MGLFMQRYLWTSVQRAFAHDLSAPHDRLNVFLTVLHPSRHLDESRKDRRAHSINVTTFAPETSPDKLDLL